MDFCKVFVGNVPFDCSNDEFSNKFKDVDGYIKAEIVTKQTSGALCSRGFGFVTVGGTEDAGCSSEQNAEKLLKRSDIDIRGRTLRFTEYVPNGKKPNRSKNNYIVLKTIPKSLSRKDIINYFTSITTIGKCFIQSDRDTGEQCDTAVVEILDNTLYNNIIDCGFVSITTNDECKHHISATTYKTHMYKKHDNKPSKLDLYNAFNAGRNMGVLEGIKIAKNYKF